MANQEHLITFWGIGAVLLVSLCVLVFSSIGVQENIGTDLAFVEDWAAAMGERIAPWFEYFFLIAGFVMLLSTNIGIMDYVSRLTGDSLKVTILRDNQFWSESKIYATVVWILAIGGSLLIWTGIEPIVLLTMSAAGGFFVMATYSTLLNFLNRRYLPEYARLKGWRSPVMVIVALFYLLPTLYVTYILLTQGLSAFA